MMAKSSNLLVLAPIPDHIFSCSHMKFCPSSDAGPGGAANSSPSANTHTIHLLGLWEIWEGGGWAFLGLLSASPGEASSYLYFQYWHRCVHKAQYKVATQRGVNRKIYRGAAAMKIHCNGLVLH